MLDVNQESYAFEPFATPIGAEVKGINLKDDITESAKEFIEFGLEKFGVLVFRDQDVTPEEQIQFSATFGKLDIVPREQDRLDGRPEIFVIGNPEGHMVVFAPELSEDGDEGELEWHTDHSQYEVPARATLLYGKEVPEKGGDTAFSCMYSAYESLPDRDKQAFSSVNLIHSVKGLNNYLRKLEKHETLNDAELKLEKDEGQTWPLVRKHPVSGRKALYFGSHMCVGAKGYSNDDATKLIQQVTNHATKPEFQYRHKWKKNDVVMWDNRRLIHAATPFDVKNDRRVIYRTTIMEPQPVVM